MHKFIYLCLCLFILGIHTNKAQNCNYTLEGVVVQSQDLIPIEGVSIFISNLNAFATSDKEGVFRFENLCAGDLSLEFKHISFKTKRLNIKLKGDKSLKLSLDQNQQQLGEVFIKSSNKTNLTSVEKGIKLNTIEQFTDKSIGDALNTLSGVSSLNTGNAIVKPMIHGLHSSRLLIINNNVRQFDQEWGDEHAPNIDINAGGSIAVIKGANTLKYGSDAIGGLILIKPKKYPTIDSIFGSVQTSFNSNGMGGNLNAEVVKTTSKGFYTKIQTNYKRFGDFEAASYNLSNSGLESMNASLQFGYNSYEKGFDAYYSYVNNNIGIIRAAHVGNVNDLVRAINSGEPNFIEDFSYDINNPRQSVIHHLGKIEAYRRWEGFGKLTLQYDFQLNRRKEYDRRRASFLNIPAADFRLFTTSFQPNLKIETIDKLELNTGFLLRYQQNSSSDVAETGISIPLIPDYDRFETGVYVTTNYELSDDIEFSAGIRYDFTRIEAEKKYKVFDWEQNNYDELFGDFSTGRIENFEIYTAPEFDFNNVSASLGVIKHFDKDIDLIFNYGLASRMPNVSELFSDGLHHSAARIETGSLTIGKEIANKFILSFERQHDNFGFSISPYFKHIKDFIQLIPSSEASTTIRGAFVKWEYNQVDARIFGVDIDINKKIHRNLDYQGSISLLRGDNLSEDIPLINMPATNFSNRISYVNEALNQLSISFTQRTVFEQTRFPNYNFNTFNPVIQQDVLVDISATPPTYSLFGFQSSAVFKAFGKGNLKVEFNIENIFNVTYREHLNRLRFFADDLGRNYNIKIKINY